MTTYFDPDTLDRAAPKMPRAKAKPRRDEDGLHQRVAVLLSRIIARPGVASADGVVWYSLEPRARRSIYEGARNKARGVIAGCPDLDIYYDGFAYKIELKAPGGVISQAQRELHHEIVRAGVRVRVCYSMEEVLAALRAWSVPHKAVQL